MTIGQFREKIMIEGIGFTVRESLYLAAYELFTEKGIETALAIL